VENQIKKYDQFKALTLPFKVRIGYIVAKSALRDKPGHGNGLYLVTAFLIKYE